MKNIKVKNFDDWRKNIIKKRLLIVRRNKFSCFKESLGEIDTSFFMRI